MAAARHLYVVTSRRLVSNGGYRGCDPLMSVYGMRRRMFSTRGTPAAGGLEAPPQNYNQDYYKPPPDHHYINQDYYNPSVDHSKISRDGYFNNMSDQKRHLSEMDYDFKKLQQCIFRMEYDFAKYRDKLHICAAEIRDENKKVTNDLRDENQKVTNDLSKICEEHMVKRKKAADILFRAVILRCTIANWILGLTALFVLLKTT